MKKNKIIILCFPFLARIKSIYVCIYMEAVGKTNFKIRIILILFIHQCNRRERVKRIKNKHAIFLLFSSLLFSGRKNGNSLQFFSILLNFLYCFELYFSAIRLYGFLGCRWFIIIHWTFYRILIPNKFSFNVFFFFRQFSVIVLKNSFGMFCFIFIRRSFFLLLM